MANCYLRLTELTLADGRAWKFRALPYTVRGIAIVKAFSDAETQIMGFRDGVSLSLSYDQTAEEIEAFWETGLVPLVPSTDEEQALFGKIIGAMVAQAGKE